MNNVTIEQVYAWFKSYNLCNMLVGCNACKQAVYGTSDHECPKQELDMKKLSETVTVVLEERMNGRMDIDMDENALADVLFEAVDRMNG